MSRAGVAFLLVKFLEGLKSDLLFTAASPNLIIPQKAHVAIAQTQASKGESRSSDALTRRSKEVVTGGRIGFL